MVHEERIGVGRTNEIMTLDHGTAGRVGAQTLSMSQLLGWKWKSEKPIATGIHNKRASLNAAPEGIARRSETRRAGTLKLPPKKPHEMTSSSL